MCRYVPTPLWGLSGHVQTIVHAVVGRVRTRQRESVRRFARLADGATLTWDEWTPLDEHPAAGQSRVTALCDGGLTPGSASGCLTICCLDCQLPHFLISGHFHASLSDASLSCCFALLLSFPPSSRCFVAVPSSTLMLPQPHPLVVCPYWCPNLLLSLSACCLALLLSCYLCLTVCCLSGSSRSAQSSSIFPPSHCMFLLI